MTKLVSIVSALCVSAFLVVGATGCAKKCETGETGEACKALKEDDKQCVWVANLKVAKDDAAKKGNGKCLKEGTDTTDAAVCKKAGETGADDKEKEANCKAQWLVTDLTKPCAWDGKVCNVK